MGLVASETQTRSCAECALGAWWVALSFRVGLCLFAVFRAVGLRPKVAKNLEILAQGKGKRKGYRACKNSVLAPQ